MAQKVAPSLIFVNPAIDSTRGLEMCKTIHDMEPLKNVPIVVLSVFKETIDPRYTSLYGIVDSLKKPFSPEELISKTENVLGMKSVHVQPVMEPVLQEDVGVDESEKEIVREEPEMPEIQQKVAEKVDVSDKTEVDRKKERDSSGKTIVKQISHVKPEGIAEGEREKTYTLKRTRRRDTKKRLFIPIIVVVVIMILSAAGIVLFKIVPLPWEKVQAPVAVKLPETVQKQPVDVSPSQEQQKPQEEVIVEKQPAPIPSPVPSPPVAQSEAKLLGKIVYSVQIGAFENKNNAEALAKQYKEKGYETFIHTSTPKDKRTLYRVLIGKFENKKEAARLAEAIIAKEKIKATISRE